VSIVDRLKKRAAAALHLPVIGEAILASPAAERAAAVQGLVPKRCGLCRNFSRGRFEEEVQRNPAFADAMKHLRPAQMGRARHEPYTNPGSERARELRPTLTERWEDFGACLAFQDTGLRVIWGFSEQPAMPEPEDAPCERWR